MAIRARFTFLRMLDDMKTGWLSAFFTQLLLLYWEGCLNLYVFPQKNKHHACALHVLIVLSFVRFKMAARSRPGLLERASGRDASRTGCDKIRSQFKMTGGGGTDVLEPGHHWGKAMLLMAKNAGMQSTSIAHNRSRKAASQQFCGRAVRWQADECHSGDSVADDERKRDEEMADLGVFIISLRMIMAFYHCTTTCQFFLNGTVSRDMQIQGLDWKAIRPMKQPYAVLRQLPLCEATNPNSRTPSRRHNVKPSPGWHHGSLMNHELSGSFPFA